ncbi:MAG: ethylbenzene dehydrogenase-related protein [Alphaproteobacteria bacterium]
MLAAGPTFAAKSATIDWSKIPTNTVSLFYPGQSSYQWLRGKEHKRAFRKTEQGDSCISCHEDEEAEIGAKIVSGERLEPHPIEGKQATIDLAVQAAHDSDNLYLRFQWNTLNPFPGTAHPHWRFDGTDWKQIGWPRLHKKVWDEGQPAIYEDRLSMMIDDGSVPMFAEQGCWLSCHDGMRDMPDLAETADVKAHPLLGKVLKKKDVRKFLPSTRNDDNATWDNTKSVEEIAAIKAAGGFVDLMQWRGHRSRPIGMADDGYVLQYRLTDAGKNIFSKNWDKAANQPKYMFDKAKVGFNSRVIADIRDTSQPSSLIVGKNTVAFDPNAGWKEGDMIPEYYVNPEGAKGSAADNSNVEGSWKDGTWTVVFTRKLDTGHPEDDKIMKVGGVYTFGFAVHDDNITTRGHHVSWPMTVGIGAEADIEAVTQ